MKPRFFRTPVAFGRWLERNHARVDELWVGFWKKGTGKPSLTWPESVEQALCWGWIDGLRKGVDDESYAIRFTPRKPTSNWSLVNVRTVERLIAEGRLRPPGRAAWEARDPARSGVYSFENRKELAPSYRQRLKANRDAWEFFAAQPSGYRRTAGHWVMAAKREATQERRLATLIDDSAAGRRIAPLRRAPAARAPKK